MKQVSRDLETIEKMQAFLCHMEDKDKTYVNDLLSGDKNRMSENVMSAITSLSLKIRTLRDILWKTMLALERVKSEAGIIFSTQRWGVRTPDPPPPPWIRHCHMIVSLVAKIGFLPPLPVFCISYLTIFMFTCY